MAQLGRFDQTFTDNTGAPISGGSVNVYREGATVNGAQSGTTPLTVTVHHRGKIVASDSVFVNATTGTTYTVNSVTATTVVLSGFAGTLALSSGDRLTPSNSQPTLYGDDQGGATTSNPLTTSSLGRANCWMEFGAYDFVLSGGGATTQAFTSQVVPTEAIGQVRYADAFATGSSTGGIQEAINDLPSTGGMVMLSGNTTYAINAAITVSTNDVTVEGAGDSSLITNAHATGVHIFTVTGHRCTFRNFKIDGQNATRTNGRGVNITTGNDCTVDSLNIASMPDGCVVGEGGAVRVTVRNCRFTSPGDAGSTDGYGVLLNSSVDGKIINNYIDTPRLSGIFLFNQCDDALIEGNKVLSGLDNGIRWSATGTASSRVRCIGNYVTGVAVDGFRCTGISSVVAGNVAASCTQSGFKTDASTGGIWANNYSISNAGAGFKINQATSNSDGLKLVGNFAAGNGEAGITIVPRSTTVSNITIQNNTCRDNGTDGVRITAGGVTGGTITGLKICGNLCLSNTGAGIDIDTNLAGNLAWTDINISNNDCITNTTYGVLVAAHVAASTIRVQDNYYRGNTTAAQLLSSANWTYQAREIEKTAIASAATIAVTGDGSYSITGTADITSITAAPAGTRISLRFTGTAATNGVVDGSNLALAGNFAYTPNDTLELLSDGTNWVECGRSAN